MPSPAKIAPSETLKTFKYTFPPFPEVPEGVTIVPFEDFQECGIQVDLTGSADDGEVEKDGLGIPTIQLRVKHDTDISKTNPERVRKKEVRGGGFRKEWWEDWAEGEDLRNHGPYDVNVARIDRFHQAATDFQKYRKFPPMSTNVQWLWDQLRIFSGLLASTPVWHKVSDKTAEDADDFDDDFEDDDSGSKSVYQGGPGERRYPPRPRPRAPYDRYGKAATVVEDDEDIRKLLDDARAVKEDKLVVFLDNPARSIQVFLSSYMTYQGIIYADKNLTSAPHLLRFFVNYLLRNKVLPDKTCTRSLQQSLEVIDKAAVELPLTSKLAKVLPDVFGEACQGCWGGRGENPLDSGARAAVDADAAFESILKEENVEVIKLGADEGPMPETADAPDNVPETVTAAPETDAAAAASWENNGSAAETDWALPHPSSRPSLLSLLGPTALPLTHAPGIVESSVRRIKSVVMPLEANPNPNASATEDAEAVERVLEGRFARVVMAPWVDWDPESPARILRSSVGAVATPVIAPAVPDVPSSDSAPADADPPLGPGGLKPHALETDDITVLLDPEVARTLCVGIGLSGTWVQLARQVDLPAAAAPAEEDVNEENEAKLEKNPKPKKKKTLTKAQKERRGLRYWYLDEHMMVLPSYWLV
ncbi:hypothetical protein MSAN_01524300 [Mycena sanguinolenta]|uniref:Uncharacterized protein n=1 Tax=Mycena sanguinolenta TaxID=230812 RepID=A0A8H6Y3B6_9AGAR|nr:hypothetical protein MSAN_01524300 [Mycena sanguinolenta]